MSSVEVEAPELRLVKAEAKPETRSELRPHPLPELRPHPVPEARLHPLRPPEPARLPGADSGRRMEDLVRQYSKLIRVMVARVGKRLPAHVREDIEQRVLIALWKQLRREQSISHPTTYIYKTAVREAMRVRRQEGLRSQESLEHEVSAGRMPARDDPHSTLIRKEKMAQIRAALGAIAPDRRQAVWAHLSGFDLTEIMRRYGWPYHKARNLVARGLADVRRVLRDNGWAPVAPGTTQAMARGLPLARRPPAVIGRTLGSSARPLSVPRPGNVLTPRTRPYQARLRRLQTRIKSR